MTDAERAENLLSLTERLVAAVEADITLLQTGNYPPLALVDPVIDQLSAAYTREVTAVKKAGLKDAPAPLLASLKAAAAKLKDLLKRHAKIVSAMRGASEGMIKAIAEEVEKRRTAAMPYAAKPGVRPAASASAIVYNRVV